MIWPFQPFPGARWWLFGRLRRRPQRAHRRPPAEHDTAAWSRDPLSHPALQEMTQRQLGDLPFDPRDIAEE